MIPENESDLLGEPTSDAPKLDADGEHCRSKKGKRGPDGTSYFQGYCRNHPGKGTDHVGEGRCSFHDGPGGPSGPENGNWQHGLYSDVIRPEDRDTLDRIQAMSTAAKLEDTLNLQVLKLRRAVESMEDSEQSSFWVAFSELISKVEEPEETDLRSLAQMLGENDRAIREWMDLIRKTAKDLHGITDGERVRVEGEVGASEELEALMEEAGDLF